MMKNPVFSAIALLVGGGLILAQSTERPAEGSRKSMMMQKKEGGCAMMADHAELQKLADQLAAGLTALQKLNDLGALKANLATNQALLEQLRGKIKSCQMMGTTAPAAAGTPEGHEGHH